MLNIKEINHVVGASLIRLLQRRCHLRKPAPEQGVPLLKVNASETSACVPTNEAVVNEFNRNNGIKENERQAALNFFMASEHTPLKRLISQYTASMNQDQSADWQSRKPPRPAIVYGKLPANVDESVDILGIGGLFAYLNVPYQAFKHTGTYGLVTNPHDTWTFAAWTLHPEEDMDQRLVAMYRTAALVRNELRRMLRRSEGPRHPRFKSFKIDYSSAVRLFKEDPREFLKLIQVALEYVIHEFTDSEHRYARINLKRNAATIRALKEMGRVGNNPDRDIVNMCARIVFEIPEEPAVDAKKRLKREYGLEGRRLSIEEVKEIYGDSPQILDDMARGALQATQYPGGHFLAGFKENALHAVQARGGAVYDNAVATRITVDPETGKYAVTIRPADGQERTIMARTLLLALGGYDDGVIPVDGLSTLFVIRTANERYRMYPTGMGEGGNIHVVPVWTLERQEAGKTYYYHLGKATNGAIMGRNPRSPKRIYRDKDFFIHLETYLRKIIPQTSQLIWLAATECGRPVSAKQGYSVKPVQAAIHPPEKEHLSNSFEATGGCGLGANTAIIPEVQAALDHQSRT